METVNNAAFDDIAVLEGHILEPHELPPCSAWNLEVTQIYDARKVRLYKDDTLTNRIFLDGRGIKIAILDTGVDCTHPDLVSRIEGGVNFVTGDEKDTQDYHGHGTWVTSLLGGRNQDRGIAPAARLYTVKIAEKTTGKLEWLVKGMAWALKESMDIVVIASTVEGQPKELKQICMDARKNGIAIIAAAGKDFCAARWPAGWSSEYALSVGAVELKHEHAKEGRTAGDTQYHFPSNIWPYIDFVAPGHNVIAAWPGNKYYLGSGTSIAVPHVAGILALGLSVVRQIQVQINIQELEMILKETAFTYSDPESFELASGYGHFLDPEKRIFRNDWEVLRAMYGVGMVQAKNFVSRICAYINAQSENRKIFIEESII